MTEQDSDSASLTINSDGYDMCCDICAEDDKRALAEGYCVDCRDYLCGDCFRGHKRNRTSREHGLQDRTQMPLQKPPPLAPMSRIGFGAERCAHHPERVVEYFCKDDHSLGCSVCMTMDHRHCDEVDLVVNLSENLLDSEEYIRFIDELEYLETKSQSIVDKTLTNALRSRKIFVDAGKTVRFMRKKVMDAFDKCEGVLQKQAETLTSEDLAKLRAVSVTGKSIIAEIKKVSAYTQRLKKTNRLGQLFIQMIKHQDNSMTFHRLVNEADENNDSTVYSIEPSSLIQHVLDDPSSVATISFRIEEEADNSDVASFPTTSDRSPEPRDTTTATDQPLRKDLADVRIVCLNDISVGTESDNLSSFKITGSVVLPNNRLVLTAYWNSKVKLINTKKKSVTCQLTTPSGPWDVASISRDKVALTLPDSKRIVFMQVTNNMWMDREIPTKGECRSIICDNEKLIVGYAVPKKIEIMDLNGITTEMFNTTGLIECPTYMALSPDHQYIYVSDTRSGTNFVERIARRDDVVDAVYCSEDLATPRGVTVDLRGNVFVCGGVSGNIHILNPDLTKAKVLANTLKFPNSISYCRDTDKLYVGMYTNEVKVYLLFKC